MAGKRVYHEMINGNGAAIWDEIIRPHVDRYVQSRYGPNIHVKQCNRKPVVEITTARCDIISVELSSGETLLLFLKKYGERIRRTVHSNKTLQRKRRIEVFAYQEALPRISVGTPQLVAADLAGDDNGGWLLIEAISGTKVAYFCDLEFWYVTAAWLVKFHKQVQSLGNRELAFDVFRFDHEHFADVAMEMHTVLIDRHPELASKALTLKDRVLFFADHSMDDYLTWVHGTFSAENILIRSENGQSSKKEVCPVDWESLGLGSTFFDLSQISHGYEPEFLERFVESYRNEATQLDLEALPKREFLRELYRYRSYWWCRRVRDLVKWEHSVTEGEEIFFKSEQDWNDMPE